MIELLRRENWFRLKKIQPAALVAEQITHLYPLFSAKKAVTIEKKDTTMTMKQEMLLWQYIDGDCNKEERTQVEQLLVLDAKVRDYYEEMLQMHQGFQHFFANQAKAARIRNINK